MGRTFLAVDEDTPLKRKCVIKQFFPAPGIAKSPTAFKKALELFKREAATLDRLSDEATQIPRLLAYLEQDQRFYLVQEFVDGKNLLIDLQQRQEDYTEADIRHLLQNLLPVLKFIHQRGVVHRDIKLENIMRCTDGRLVLIDFGISKELRGTMVGPGTIGGTLGYAPLEQMVYGQAYPASDLYSLGATCIHLLTNTFPHDLYNHRDKQWQWREVLASQGKQISPALERILTKLLQEDHRQRYHSADEVLTDLQSPFGATGSVSSGSKKSGADSTTETTSSPDFEPPGDELPRKQWRKLPWIVAGLTVLGLGGYGVLQALPESTGAAGTSGVAASSSSPLDLEPGKTAEDYYADGSTLLEQQNYQAAIESFNKAIELDPNYALAFNDRGVANYHLNNLQTAQEDYSKAIELDPNYAYAYHNRGIVSVDLNQNNEALADFNRSIELDPSYVSAYNYRCYVYNNLGDSQRALTDCNKAIELDPSYSYAYHNRGIANYNLGKRQEALADYNKAVELNPSYANSYVGRGLTRHDLKDLPGALADYNKAIELDPQNVIAYNNRCYVRNDLTDYQQAIADCNKAIELNPNYALAFSNRGNAYYFQNDYQNALADYNQAIELDPNYGLAYYNRGNVHHALRDLQKALTDHNKAIELSPTYANAYYNRALVHKDLGNTQQARGDFQRASELYQQQGDTENYQRSLDQIRELS